MPSVVAPFQIQSNLLLPSTDNDTSTRRFRHSLSLPPGPKQQPDANYLHNQRTTASLSGAPISHASAPELATALVLTSIWKNNAGLAGNERHEGGPGLCRVRVPNGRTYWVRPDPDGRLPLTGGRSAKLVPFGFGIFRVKDIPYGLTSGAPSLPRSITVTPRSVPAIPGGGAMGGSGSTSRTLTIGPLASALSPAQHALLLSALNTAPSQRMHSAVRTQDDVPAAGFLFAAQGGQPDHALRLIFNGNQEVAQAEIRRLDSSALVLSARFHASQYSLPQQMPLPPALHRSGLPARLWFGDLAAPLQDTAQQAELHAALTCPGLCMVDACCINTDTGPGVIYSYLSPGALVADRKVVIALDSNQAPKAVTVYAIINSKDSIASLVHADYQPPWLRLNPEQYAWLPQAFEQQRHQLPINWTGAFLQNLLDHLNQDRIPLQPMQEGAMQAVLQSDTGQGMETFTVTLQPGTDGTAHVRKIKYVLGNISLELENPRFHALRQTTNPVGGGSKSVGKRKELPNSTQALLHVRTSENKKLKLKTADHSQNSKFEPVANGRYAVKRNDLLPRPLVYQPVSSAQDIYHEVQQGSNCTYQVFDMMRMACSGNDIQSLVSMDRFRQYLNVVYANNSNARTQRSTLMEFDDIAAFSAQIGDQAFDVVLGCRYLHDKQNPARSKMAFRQDQRQFRELVNLRHVGVAYNYVASTAPSGAPVYAQHSVMIARDSQGRYLEIDPKRHPPHDLQAKTMQEAVRNLLLLRGDEMTYQDEYGTWKNLGRPFELLLPAVSAPAPQSVSAVAAPPGGDVGKKTSKPAKQSTSEAGPSGSEAVDNVDGKKLSTRPEKVVRAAATQTAFNVFNTDQDAAVQFNEYGKKKFEQCKIDGVYDKNTKYSVTVFGKWFSIAKRFNQSIAEIHATDGNAISSARAWADQSDGQWEKTLNTYLEKHRKDRSTLQQYREFMQTGAVTFSDKLGKSTPHLEIDPDQQEDWDDFSRTLSKTSDTARHRTKRFFQFLAKEWKPAGDFPADAKGKRLIAPRALLAHNKEKFKEAFDAYCKLHPGTREQMSPLKTWLGIGRKLQLPEHRQLLTLFRKDAETKVTEWSAKVYGNVVRQFLRHIESGHATDGSGKALRDSNGNPYTSVLDLERDKKLDQAKEGVLCNETKRKLFLKSKGVEANLNSLCQLAKDYNEGRLTLDAEFEEVEDDDLDPWEDDEDDDSGDDAVTDGET